MSDVKDDSIDITVAARTALERYESVLAKPGTFWAFMGGEREDAQQEALTRAWKATETFNGEGDMLLHVLCQAKYGIMDYVRRLEADRKKRRSTRTVHVGLDDEEICTTVEVKYSHELNTEEAKADEPEAAQPDVEEPKDVTALRAVLNTAMSGCLAPLEYKVVRLRYGLDSEPMTPATISDVLDTHERTVYRLLRSGMAKLKAEFRADEIVNL